MIEQVFPGRRSSQAFPSAEAVSQQPGPHWQVLSAAVAGVSHRRTGLPCQDAVDYRVLPDGGLLIAQADGAGSARRSEQGARWAVAEALGALEAGLRFSPPGDAEACEELVREAFRRASRSLHLLADADCEPVREFASTLTCVAALDGWLAVGQIGDGAVVARDPDGAMFAVTHPQKGEYANETSFITQPDVLEQIEIQVLEQPVSALAVMSDGLIRLALELPTGAPYIPFFEPLFAHARAGESPAAAARLADFLASDRVSARTDDDKSLVVAVRRVDE